MEDRERPAYEEALELLATARRRPQGLSGFLSVLTHPEESPFPVGTSPVTWLASWHRSAAPELREALVGGVLGLLRDPGTDAGTLARTLAFVEAAELHEAVQAIRELVDFRRLTQISGEYSDLHGRALRAMFVLDSLKPIQCLERELRYGKYVPLAFAFVREKAKDDVPRALSWIALYPFFPEALRTVLLTYPYDGLELLGKAARAMLTEEPKVQAFLAALPHLPFTSHEREELARMLERRPARVAAAASSAAASPWRPTERRSPFVIGARFAGLHDKSLSAFKQLRHGDH